MFTTQVVSVYTLNTGNERYRVLDTDPDVSLSGGEYLNRLVIPEAGSEDSGMYICFVTNSGFGALTYKSAYLTVVPRPEVVKTIEGEDSVDSNAAIQNIVVAVVATVVGTTLIVGVVGMVCVIRKRKESNNGSDDNKRASSSEDSMMQQHPFLMSSKHPPFDQIHNLTPASTSSSMFAASSLHQHHQPWTAGMSSTVYPAYDVGRIRYSDGLYENPNNNQYEVPYSHLMHRNNVGNSFNGNSSYRNSNNSSAKSSFGTNSNSFNRPLIRQPLEVPPPTSSFGANHRSGGGLRRHLTASAASTGHILDEAAGDAFGNLQYFQYLGRNSFEA